MSQLQSESLARMRTSLEQINDVCGNILSFESKESDNMMFDSTPPMDFDHFESNAESFTSLSPPSNFCSVKYPTHSSSPFDAEDDCSFCNICRCLGHEREDCPGFPYYDVMSESETSDINANPFGEEDCFHEVHSSCEVHNF